MIFNGNGKLTYFNGQILEGEFKNDIRTVY